MSNKNIKPLPTQEYLLECFRYEPETGLLYWRERPLYHFRDENKRIMKVTNSKNVGNLVGYLNSMGYYDTELEDVRYRVHRIVWKLYYGVEPREFIDHINGDRTDNRIENLREANYNENMSNVKKSSKNTSGYKGVSWIKSKKKYRCVLTYNKKSIFLGYFDDPKEAHKVYCEASLKYHKEFSNFG